MKNLSYTLLLMLILSTGATAAPSELTTWMENSSHELITSCEKVTQKKWLAHYNEIENKIVDRISKMSDADWEKIPIHSAIRDVLEIIYPQDLPKNYPMRGAFASCFEYFEEYQKAKPEALHDAVKAIEECYQDRYKKSAPTMLNRYISCLKLLKADPK